MSEGTPEAFAIDALDVLLDPTVRAELERRYWHPIEALTTIEVLTADERFFADPGRHFGLFSDHGVVHVRDVAVRSAALIRQVNGVLVAGRDESRLSFMAAFVVAAAYLHDIGMVDTSPHGRRVHADYAAQEPFQLRFDDLADRLWKHDGSLLRDRIEQVSVVQQRPVDGETVLRELLSLALCHSKSAVPAALLDDRGALATRLRRSIFTSLSALAERDRTTSTAPIGPAVRFYDEPLTDSYRWLEGTSRLERELADDAIDALRVLRAADALRQRGTTLRTTSGFEVFVDASTGYSVFGLRCADRSKVIYLRVGNMLSSGEANVADAHVTPAGDLRIAFHRGSFSNAAASGFAATAAATVVADIAADVLLSFDAATPAVGLSPPMVLTGEARLELVRPTDHPTFAATVLADLCERFPAMATRAVIVEDDDDEPPPAEPSWRERGEPVHSGSALADLLLRQLEQSGLRTERIDRNAAFEGIRRISVARGETVITAGCAASFVLVPMEEGLAVVSLGGYRRQPGRPWVPVGVTGVIRGAERNSVIVAERALDVILIPGATFAEHWFHPFDEVEVREIAQRLHRD